MKTDVKRIEKNKVQLEVEVPSDRIGEAIEEAYRRLSQRANIPGFRKGRIPKEVIDTKIGKEPVYEEALNLAVPGYYYEAVESSGLEPIAKPEFEIVQIEEGKPLKFNAKVEVKPEVKLGPHTGVRAKRPSTRVTEKEIDEQLEILRERFASVEPVEGRKLRYGDAAIIDFEGFVDDEPVEGGSAADYMLEIGSKTFVPGIEDQLVGMEVDTERRVVTTMPADYHAQQIAGKEVVFNVRLKGIREKHLPALDDSFAEQVGGFDSLKKLREDLKGRLKSLKEIQAEAEVKEQVLSKVAKDAKVDIPKTMIDDQTMDMLRDFATSLTQQGVGIEQYLEARKLTLQELRDNFRPDAERRIKNQLVLETVARKQGLEATPEDIDNEIASVARGLNKEFEEVRQSFVARGATPIVREQVLARKALDWLAERADVAGGKRSASAEVKKKEAKKAARGPRRAKTGDSEGEKREGES